MSCKTKPKSGYCKAGELAQFQARIIGSPGAGYTSPSINPQFVGLLDRSAQGECSLPCSWFWVTVHPISVLRRDPLTVRFPPLSVSQISTTGQRRSSLKVRLTLSDSTNTQRVIVADVGSGFSIPWYGPGVKIDVLTFPINAAGGDPNPIVQPGNNVADMTGTLVEDAVIEANAVVVEEGPPGDGDPLLFTQTRTVLAGPTDIFFERPAGARRVACYIGTSPPAAIAFSASPSAPVDPTHFVGQVILPPAFSILATNPLDVPGVASALVYTQCPPGTYSVVWEVKP